MITTMQQTHPLYVTAAPGRVYLVVGWLQSTASWDLTPVLAPVSHRGPVRPAEPGVQYTYSATPPAINPNAAETAVLPRVPR